MENFKCPHCDKEIDSVLIKNHFKESEKKRLRNEIEKEIGGENDKKIEARLMRERESDKMKLEQERERDKLKMDRLKKAMLNVKQTADKGQKQADQGLAVDQGSSQENVLGKYLKEQFSGDNFYQFKKGEPGADWLQDVKNEKGKIVGKILYESKDEPSSFQSKWEPKLQNDMKDSNADLGVIFSASVPRDFSKKQEFQKKGNIYICKNDSYALKFIVMVLRMNLIMKDSLKVKGKENLLTAFDLLEDSRTRNFLSLLDMGHKKAIKDASKLVTSAEKNLINLKGSDEQYESFLKLLEELVAIEFSFKKKNKI